jgi:cytochrome c5
MSANDHNTAHEEAHNGPIKTPKQLLAAVFFSFVIPIFGIIGLVYFVNSANKPAGTVDSPSVMAERIQKIGTVEIRDANRTLKTGEEVYKGQCVACHSIGAAGSPKFGDVAAWTPRIATGYEALLNSALKGKGAMAAQGGGDYEDLEIARAVVYMAAAAGGKFAEPVAPASLAVVDASAPSVASAPAAAPIVAASPALVAPAASSSPTSAMVKISSGNGEALYKQVCIGCHAAGVAGAPKFGDKTAWAPRIQTGIDAMTATVIKGKGAMPPKGGANAPDADIRSAVEYMANAAK